MALAALISLALAISVAAAPDWTTATWICTNGTQMDTRTSSVAAQVNLTAPVALATLFIAGVGQHSVNINGQRVNGSVFDPPWTTFTKRVLYETLDVSSLLLSPGLNALAVTLGNGMYNVPSSPRYSKFTGSVGPRALIALLVVTYADGSSANFSSNADAGVAGTRWWATDDGPITFSHIYGGEDVNASQALTGWDQPGYDFTPPVWAPAVACPPPSPTSILQASSIPPVRVMENTYLQSAHVVDPISIVLDLGRNIAGWPTLSLAGVNGSQPAVQVWPGEALDAPGGDVEQDSSGTPMYWSYAPNAAAAGANVTWTPTTSFYGWRYLRVTPVDTQASLRALAARGVRVLGMLDASNTITVVNATYGGNCNPSLAGNLAHNLSIACNGQDGVCLFPVQVGPNMPDPAPECAKDFIATFSCSSNATRVLTAFLPAEANGHTLVLNCTDFMPSLPVVTGALGNAIRVAAATVGTFTCDNAQYNAIHNITLAAMRANLQSILTDCPHREKLGWLEVSHLLAPALAYNLDIHALWSKLSVDTSDSQLASGMVPDIAPEVTVFSGGFRDSPEWGSASVLNPAFVLSWYSDTSAANATGVYATMKSYLAYLLQQRNAAGIITYGLGDWLSLENTPAGVTATAILYEALQAAARVATALGFPADAAAFSADAFDVAAAYNAAFYGGPAAPYPSQCAAGMALALGIAASNGSINTTAVTDWLAAQVVAAGNVTTGGDIGNRFIIEALAARYSNVLGDSLMRTNSPGYGFMVASGETALTEMWNIGGDSHIHAMLGHIDEWFYAYVGGIRRDVDCAAAAAPSWRCITIAPVALDTVSHAHTTFVLPGSRAGEGDMDVEWRLTRGAACASHVACDAALTHAGGAAALCDVWSVNVTLSRTSLLQSARVVSPLTGAVTPLSLDAAAPMHTQVVHDCVAR